MISTLAFCYAYVMSLVEAFHDSTLVLSLFILHILCFKSFWISYISCNSVFLWLSSVLFSHDCHVLLTELVSCSLQRTVAKVLQMVGITQNHVLPMFCSLHPFNQIQITIIFLHLGVVSHCQFGIYNNPSATPWPYGKYLDLSPVCLGHGQKPPSYFPTFLELSVKQ